MGEGLRALIGSPQVDQHSQVTWTLGDSQISIFKRTFPPRDADTCLPSKPMEGYSRNITNSGPSQAKKNIFLKPNQNRTGNTTPQKLKSIATEFKLPLTNQKYKNEKNPT